jgi:hypothetical protein
MGSRPVHSTRAAKARSPKPAASPPPPSHGTPDLDEILGQLNEVHSIFACTARCLDEITDPHELEAPETCEAKDVAVLVRVGIQKLEEAQEALDIGEPTEDPS